MQLKCELWSQMLVKTYLLLGSTIEQSWPFQYCSIPNPAVWRARSEWARFGDWLDPNRQYCSFALASFLLTRFLLSIISLTCGLNFTGTDCRRRPCTLRIHGLLGTSRFVGNL